MAKSINMVIETISIISNWDEVAMEVFHWLKPQFSLVELEKTYETSPMDAVVIRIYDEPHEPPFCTIIVDQEGISGETPSLDFFLTPAYIKGKTFESLCGEIMSSIHDDGEPEEEA